MLRLSYLHPSFTFFVECTPYIIEWKENREGLSVDYLTILILVGLHILRILIHGAEAHTH